MQQVCLFLCNYFPNVCQPNRSRKLAYAGCPLPACFKRYVNVAMLLVPFSSLRWADDFRRRRGYLEVIVLLVLGSNRCSVRLLSGGWGGKERNKNITQNILCQPAAGSQWSCISQSVNRSWLLIYREKTGETGRRQEKQGGWVGRCSMFVWDFWVLEGLHCR